MLYSLQYLRAIAATLVAGYHVWPRFGGEFGVDIFFVISGFVMWETTAKSVPPTPAEFAAKRIRRIVPLYWIVTLAMFAMPLISGTVAGGTVMAPDHLLASLMFLPAPYPANPKDWFPVYVPGWTINYEMFFYALFALCLFIRAPWMRLAAITGVLAVIVLAGALSRACGLDMSGRLGWYSSPMLLEFAAGILISALASRLGHVAFPAAAAALAVGIIGLLLAPHHPGLARTFYWGIPAVLICFGALHLERLGHVPKIEWLRFLGDASYSLYLTHLFSIGTLAVVWLQLGLWDHTFSASIFPAAAVATSLIVGALVYVALERPLLSLGRLRTRPVESVPTG